MTMKINSQTKTYANKEIMTCISSTQRNLLRDNKLGIIDIKLV